MIAEFNGRERHDSLSPFSPTDDHEDDFIREPPSERERCVLRRESQRANEMQVQLRLFLACVYVHVCERVKKEFREGE